MPPITRGSLNRAEGSYAICVSRFNQPITDVLLQGALETFKDLGVDESKIDIFSVPGAYEIPLLTQKLAKEKKYDAIITLACVIRGETSHFDAVVNAVNSGLMRVMLDEKQPIIFGILTTETAEQAIMRTGIKTTNKGREAAMSAVEIVSLHKDIKSLK